MPASATHHGNEKTWLWTEITSNDNEKWSVMVGISKYTGHHLFEYEQDIDPENIFLNNCNEN